jgi:hypothetical protein
MSAKILLIYEEHHYERVDHYVGCCRNLVFPAGIYPA